MIFVAHILQKIPASCFFDADESVVVYWRQCLTNIGRREKSRDFDVNVARHLPSPEISAIVARNL